MNLFHSTRNRIEKYKSCGKKNSFATLTRSYLATRFTFFDPISRTVEEIHYFFEAMVQLYYGIEHFHHNICLKFYALVHNKVRKE